MSIASVESFIGELVSNKDFRFLSWQVLRAATLVGLVIVCILTVLTVLAAAFYNLFSELLGGVEVTVVEQEEIDQVGANPRRLRSPTRLGAIAQSVRAHP